MRWRDDPGSASGLRLPWAQCNRRDPCEWKGEGEETIQRRETKEERRGPEDALRSQSQATWVAPKSRPGQEDRFSLQPPGGGQSCRDLCWISPEPQAQTSALLSRDCVVLFCSNYRKSMSSVNICMKIMCLHLRWFSQQEGEEDMQGPFLGSDGGTWPQGRMFTKESVLRIIAFSSQRLSPGS